MTLLLFSILYIFTGTVNGGTPVNDKSKFKPTCPTHSSKIGLETTFNSGATGFVTSTLDFPETTPGQNSDFTFKILYKPGSDTSISLLSEEVYCENIF